jgi:hypothetical protein
MGRSVGDAIPVKESILRGPVAVVGKYSITFILYRETISLVFLIASVEQRTDPMVCYLECMKETKPVTVVYAKETK